MCNSSWLTDGAESSVWEEACSSGPVWISACWLEVSHWCAFQDMEQKMKMLENLQDDFDFNYKTLKSAGGKNRTLPAWFKSTELLQFFNAVIWLNSVDVISSVIGFVQSCPRTWMETARLQPPDRRWSSWSRCWVPWISSGGWDTHTHTGLHLDSDGCRPVLELCVFVFLSANRDWHGGAAAGHGLCAEEPDWRGAGWLEEETADRLHRRTS